MSWTAYHIITILSFSPYNKNEYKKHIEKVCINVFYCVKNQGVGEGGWKRRRKSRRRNRQGGGRDKEKESTNC